MTFKTDSVLKTIEELNINNKIPTLSSAPPISIVNDRSVIKKKRKKKKKTIIKTLFSRAVFLKELKNKRFTFINSGIPNNIIDTEIKHFINKTVDDNIVYMFKCSLERLCLQQKLYIDFSYHYDSQDVLLCTLGSSVESTEKDIETRLTKAWTAINRLSTIWKSDLTDKMKRSFFQAAVTSILLYGCTTWTLTKRLEKKLDGNYTRMLRAILNKSWRQHPTRHQLYGYLPPITKTIQFRRTRHAGHCWRSRDELIRDVLLWTPTHGRAKAGRPARTYIQQLCEDTGCCPEDLPRAMNDREEWRKRVRDIRAASTIWWWWYIYIYIYRYIYIYIYICMQLGNVCDDN